MEFTDTTRLRKAMKTISPDIRVSAVQGSSDRARRSVDHWTVRVRDSEALDRVRAALPSLHLKEFSMDIEGSQYDWTYCLFVEEVRS